MDPPPDGIRLSLRKNVPRKRIFSPPSPPRKGNAVTSVKRPSKTVAQRCSEYRQNLKSDPVKFEDYREKNIARAKRNREKERCEEDKQRIRALARERQRKYRMKQREAELVERRSGKRQTRQDMKSVEERREKNRLAVQKHRANMSKQKKSAERAKRMKKYYAAKASQPIVAPLSTPSPKTSKSAAALRKYVYRVKKKLSLKGDRLIEFCQTLLKSADKQTKTALGLPTSPTITTPTKGKIKRLMSPLKRSRDPKTLWFRQKVAAMVGHKTVGVKKARHEDDELYKRKTLSVKRNIVQDFISQHADPIPSKNVKSKTHVLNKPIAKIHKLFLQQAKERISSRSFFRNKPSSFLSVTKAKFRQCMCEVCMNPKLKIVSLNQNFSRSYDRDDLLKYSMCEYDAHPRRECVDRECESCGVGRVKERLLGDLSHHLSDRIVWSKWESVKHEGKSRVEKVKHSTSVQDMVDLLAFEFVSLSRHVFNASWQRQSINSLLKKLPCDWAVVMCDFAENFLCKHQDEPQTAHWSYSQVTVFPTVSFFTCSENGSCSELRKEQIIFLTDDLTHDSHSVFVFVKHAIKRLLTIRNFSKFIFVSDGCAAQFKSKLPFFHLNVLSQNVACEKVFYGSRHGKNDCDSCGGAIKRVVTRNIASGQAVIQNAKDMYDLCVQQLTIVSTDEAHSSCQHLSRSFVHVDSKDIERSFESSAIKSVPGTRRCHHVKSLAQNVLAFRDLSCFCSHCLSEDFLNCKNVSLVGNWVSRSLRIKGVIPQPNVHLFPPTPAPLSRSDFFSKTLRHFAGSTSYADLQQKVQRVLNQNTLQHYTLPPVESVPIFETDSRKVDSIALSMIPNGINYLYPALIEPDGNCMPRSLSLLAFRNQDHHVEIRCRIVIELIQNSLRYLSLDEDDLTFISQLSNHHNGNLRETFENEVLEICQLSSYMGFWQIMAAANVFHTQILSVYPARGPQCNVSFFNRLVRPVECASSHDLVIMWSSLRDDMEEEYWVANHVVPLMPLTTGMQVAYCE